MDNSKVIEDFRASGGKVGGMFEGMDLLLLNTIGAKSNKESIKPLAYSKDGDRFIIVASKGGASTNPDWYYNLLAHPDVEVEVGEEKFKVHGSEVKGEERNNLFKSHAKRYPNFNDYQTKTTRVLPLFVLERI